MEKDNQCAYCQYSNLSAHLYRLISLSVSPFRVSIKRYSLIRLCNMSPPGPVGIWSLNDVVSTSMRRHRVTWTLIRRHFHVMCPLGLFMRNIGELDGHKLLSESPPWYPRVIFVNIYIVRLSVNSHQFDLVCGPIFEIRCFVQVTAVSASRLCNARPWWEIGGSWALSTCTVLFELVRFWKQESRKTQFQN